MRYLHYLLAAAAVFFIVASFLPSIETEWWAIRLLDFPRLQVAALLLALGIALALLSRHAPFSSTALLGGVLAALICHVLVLWPYRPGGENFVSNCPAEHQLSVMIANVQLGNQTTGPLLGMVRAEKPDLLLAMETDARWSQALQPLKQDMHYGIERITGSFYGLNFFSRLPLANTEIRFLAGRDTPAVFTGVRLRDGTMVDFLGLHPKPPLPWQSSLQRDAELYSAALFMRDRNPPGILAGDLNATSWEEAVWRSRRIAHLIDPRQGYGYVPTFSATSWIQSWPLDHIFHKGGFATMEIKRLPAFGSDHYPLLVRLCRNGQGDMPPEVGPTDLEKASEVLGHSVDNVSP